MNGRVVRVLETPEGTRYVVAWENGTETTETREALEALEG